MALALSLRGVVKRYGEITAVNHFDLEVPEGTCVGLLGPNGAGKSTTMRLLTAQAIADEGEIQVLGHTLPGDSKAARAEMGVVPQLDNLDTTLTVEQNLLVFAHLYRIARSERTVTCLIIPHDLQEEKMVEPPRKHSTVHSGVGFSMPRIIPTDADKAIFWFAPIISTFTALSAFSVLPQLEHT